MLKSIHIKNFVVIDTDLELGPGFNVFSGETGAGKSIILDALGLAFGQRAQAFIRAGQTQCTICLCFHRNYPCMIGLRCISSIVS